MVVKKILNFGLSAFYDEMFKCMECEEHAYGMQLSNNYLRNLVKQGPGTNEEV